MRSDFFVWGADKHGQLGLNSHKKIITLPKRMSIQKVRNVRKVACGDSHSAILTFQGDLYLMGSNQGGKLGFQNLQFSDLINSPKKLELSRAVQFFDVSCG
jgi:alpha-tubulin suppressor-like RCC1 family protein